MTRVCTAVAAILLALSLGMGDAFAQRRVSAETEEAIRVFLTEVYLSGTIDSAREIRETYAPVMRRYWGRRNLALREVVRDKLNYFARWPVREFRLLPDTLEISRSRRDPFLYNVRFEYAFRTRRPGRVAEGFGEAQLVLEDLGDRWLVVSESGRVIQRF